MYVCVCVCVYVFSWGIYIYIYIYHHHYPVVLLARISLTLSSHLSLPSGGSDRSSRLHPVSIQSCCR